MTTAITTAQPLPIDAPFFSEAQEQMVLKTFLGGATKEEAMVLLETVRRRRLDPFSRQVYFIKRWDSAKRCEVWAIQTSIDGLRSIAERTGKYDGQDEPLYGKDEAGEFCKVKVYRKDWSPGRYAMGIAYMSEFVQRKRDGGVTAFWAKMPRLMLAKCAEALAIRKAFPEDTGGLYIAEEMGQEPHAETNVTPEVEKAKALVEAAAATLGGNTTTAPVPVTHTPTVPQTVDAHPSKHPGPALVERAQEKGKTFKAIRDAAKQALGATPPPTSEWTTEQAAAVEAVLFPVPAEDAAQPDGEP